MLGDIGRRVLAGESIRRADIDVFVQAAQNDPWELLYWSHRVRRANFGREVRLCSIVPGKLGNCSEDCKWCAQSNQAAPGLTKPKRTQIQEIRKAARHARQNHSGYLGIVNSGKCPSRKDLSDILAAAQAIADDAGHVKICVSLGEITNQQARKLAASPIVRYHHNLETSRRFFSTMVTTHTYDEKLTTIKAARQAGLSICSGGLFGLGENWDDRVELALTLRDQVQPDVVPLNFLAPIPGTALESVPPLPPVEILSIIAVYRLILPKIDLKIAGGRSSNLRDMQNWIFYAGATSCMIGNYLTTAGRSPQDDLKMIEDLGLEIVQEFKSAPNKPQST